jgi:tetratricopeptide (TPR) repeat protein
MLLEINPDYLPARENMAISYMNWGITLARRGEMRQAIETLFTALTVGPSTGTVERIRQNLVAAFTRQGIFHSEANQYDLAYQCFQRALELDPSEDSRKNLAVALIALSTVKTSNRAPAAQEELFKQPLLMGLSVSNCLNAYGAALAGLGEIKEARQAFESSLALDPQNRVARHNLELISTPGSAEGLSVGFIPIEIQSFQSLHS